MTIIIIVLTVNQQCSGEKESYTRLDSPDPTGSYRYGRGCPTL